MLNLYQLQMFLAVVDRGSFTAAAEQLHVTQPAVSEGVRALETRLGSRLFDRRGHRASVTPEGAALIASARELLEQAEQAEQEMLSRRGVVSGKLRLATATSAAAPMLAERLGGFARSHPGVRAELTARQQAALLDGLRLGEFDMGFLAEATHDNRLVSVPIGSDEWVLLAPPAHPWTATPRNEAPRDLVAPPKRKRGRPPGRRAAMGARVLTAMPASALSDQPLVLEWVESVQADAARREMRGMLDERGLAWGSLRLILEVGSPGEVVRAVEAGAGVGIISLSQLNGYAGPATAFRVEQPLARSLVAVRDKRVTLSPVMTAWWEEICNT
ncbi:MAG: LysR family transcriptional regulator [Chloroflexia bacterium]